MEKDVQPNKLKSLLQMAPHIRAAISDKIHEEIANFEHQLLRNESCTEEKTPFDHRSGMHPKESFMHLLDAIDSVKNAESKSSSRSHTSASRSRPVSSSALPSKPTPPHSSPMAVTNARESPCMSLRSEMKRLLVREDDDTPARPGRSEILSMRPAALSAVASLRSVRASPRNASLASSMLEAVPAWPVTPVAEKAFKCGYCAQVMFRRCVFCAACGKFATTSTSNDEGVAVEASLFSCSPQATQPTVAKRPTRPATTRNSRPGRHHELSTPRRPVTSHAVKADVIRDLLDLRVEQVHRLCAKRVERLQQAVTRGETWPRQMLQTLVREEQCRRQAKAAEEEGRKRRAMLNTFRSTTTRRLSSNLGSTGKVAETSGNRNTVLKSKMNRASFTPPRGLEYQCIVAAPDAMVYDTATMRLVGEDTEAREEIAKFDAANREIIADGAFITSHL